MLPFLPTTEETTARVERQIDKYDQAQNEAYEAALPYAVMNPAMPYLVNSPTYASEGASLDEAATAARTQYICGAIDMAAFEAELQRIRDNGYDTVIAEVNEQYKANQ